MSYRLRDEQDLAREIGEMYALIKRTAGDLVITQDLGLGMILWLALPRGGMGQAAYEALARHARPHVATGGVFCPGALLGLQAADAMPERVDALNAYFETYCSGDAYDRNAITHVMACSSHFPGLLLRS